MFLIKKLKKKKKKKKKAPRWMKLKNHIDWIKNKSDICLTKA